MAPETPDLLHRVAGPATSQDHRSFDLLQVGFPSVDGYTEPLVARFTPQLVAVKHHRIEPLWLFANSLRIGIREDMYPMYALHDAPFSPRVTRQSRVVRCRCRNRANSISDGEKSRCRRRANRRRALGQYCRDIGPLEKACQR